MGPRAVGDQSAFGTRKTSIAQNTIIDPRPPEIPLGSSCHGAALASRKIVEVGELVMAWPFRSWIVFNTSSLSE
jgi:hypothetical protein